MINKKELLITFIIPVYNVEKYVKECIDSIISQKVEANIELILIDDGSTDSSGTICDEYSNISNITVIHQCNRGLSETRNLGIKRAKGKYLAFIDSDDRIAKCCIKEIIQTLKYSNVDLFFMQISKFYPNGEIRDFEEKIYNNDFKTKTNKIIYKRLSKKNKYPGSACSKLYRREFLLENKILFPNDNRYSEDLGFVRDCIIYAKKMDAINCQFYEYRQNRRGSITSSITSKHITDVLLFISETMSFANQILKTDRYLANCILSFAAYEYAVLLWLWSNIEGNSENLFDELLKYQSVLKYGKSFKLKIIRSFVMIFGIKTTSNLLKKIKK